MDAEKAVLLKIIEDLTEQIAKLNEKMLHCWHFWKKRTRGKVPVTIRKTLRILQNY